MIYLSHLSLPFCKRSIDFGIGKQRIEQPDAIGQAYTKQRSIVGIATPPHEQKCFPSSDLYALGVNTIVLLTGKAPEVLIEQYSLEWRSRDYISVSWKLAQVLDKLLADKPKDRYQSAGDVLAALEPPIAPTVAVVSPAPIGKPLQTTQAIEIRIKQCYLINPAFIERCQQELTNCIGRSLVF